MKLSAGQTLFNWSQVLPLVCDSNWSIILTGTIRCMSQRQFAILQTSVTVSASRPLAAGCNPRSGFGGEASPRIAAAAHGAASACKRWVMTRSENAAIVRLMTSQLGDHTVGLMREPAPFREDFDHIPDSADQFRAICVWCRR